MDMATPTATTRMALIIMDHTIMDLVMDTVCRISSNLLQSPLYFKKGTKQFIILYEGLFLHCSSCAL